jgi:putative ABC transport system permease protein
MVLRILKKDLRRNRLITSVLFLFICLSALLAAAGSGLIITLVESLDSLFVQSKAPHFVQMHAGEIDKESIAGWAAANPLVKAHQIVEMLNIDGSGIRLSGKSESEEHTVMDIGFVTQNTGFDFLLDSKNQIIRVSPGEIALPVYYIPQGGAKIGDKVTVARQGFEKIFTVTAFLRDPQMNPSIVHSKRFLVHQDDFKTLRESVGETEYLIEFLLRDLEDLDAFSADYQTTNMPAEGPAVNYNLFKVLNGLTDGVVAAVIISAGLLLIGISLLCLRFTLRSTVEEDYREIGVMKAIGFGKRDIRKIYMIKYTFTAGLAVFAGYGLSLYLNRIFTGGILLNLGEAPRSLSRYLVPFLTAVIVFTVVVLSCRLVLKRFNKISASEALRAGTGGNGGGSRLPSLGNSKLINVNIFLGIKDLIGGIKNYSLVFLVFFAAVFIIIVPVNFLGTLESPAFITYMGIGRSDIRIDLRRTDDMEERFRAILARIKSDPDVPRSAAFVTCRYKVENSDGVLEDISVETGDFSVFPLEYQEGRAPIGDNEIALSYLNARDLEKSVGETLRLITKGGERKMTVSGIYQDITNGGRTAKAALPPDEDNVLWYVVGLDLDPAAGIEEKIDEYTREFYPAKVTHIDGYLHQTLGNTIEQLTMITLVIILIALLISVLITSLFMKMLLSKDRPGIAVMRSIGFSSRDIRTQYITRMLVLLGAGILLGTIFSNTLGQGMVSGILSFLGASRVRFVIDPFIAYFLCPLALIAVVTAATLASMGTVRKSGPAELNFE